jgi:ABC-2 type transport system ATP-binding protein
MVKHDEKYWSKYARGYDRRGEYVVGTAILEAIARRLSQERDLGEVVEFGCGTGYFTRAIAGSATHVLATDLSDEMLQVARVQLREFDNVTVERADAGRTAFPPGRFDSVLMANLVHVIENPLPCLRESHRILRDGGLLLAVDFTGHGMHRSERAKLGVRYVSRFGIPPRHTKLSLSPHELASLAEGAGFRVEAVYLIEEQANALYLRGRK